MSEAISRRGFTKATLSSVLTATMLQTLFERDAFAASIKPITEQWFRDFNDLCKSVADKKLPHAEWHNKVEQLYQKITLEEMFGLIDFEKLQASKPLRVRGGGEASHSVRFPEIEGLPTRLAFGRQVFAINEGSSVVPHGHNNMATAFYVLKGQFHGRHYDRMEDQESHMIIKPTIDDTFGPTSVTTVSDFKDNVHWFKSVSGVGYIFNIHVIDYEGEATGRVYVDPNGEKLSGGLIRARYLNGTEAYKLYG